MGSHQQFPVYDGYRAADEKGKAEQQLRPIITTMDQKKADEKGGQEIKNAPQGDQAMITHPLKDLVNDGLKHPVVVIPGFFRDDVGEEGIAGNDAVLPQIAASGEVVPKIGVVSHDGPGYEISDLNREKNYNE